MMFNPQFEKKDDLPKLVPGKHTIILTIDEKTFEMTKTNPNIIGQIGFLFHAMGFMSKDKKDYPGKGVICQKNIIVQ